MKIEDKLDKFICNYIYTNNKSPESLRISLNDFKQLNKVKKFRGIPLIIVDDNNEILDFSNDVQVINDEKELLINIQNRLESIREIIIAEKIISSDLKDNIKWIINDLSNSLNNIEVY